MKDEDAFNAFLSKKFKALGSWVKALKMAEKYHIGIPDFALWSGGRGVVVESKFLPSLDVGHFKGVVLKHPFSGPQQTFLQDTLRAGTPAFGLIGIDDVKQMILVPANLIPKTGSWSTPGLVHVSQNGAPVFDYGQVEEMVRAMFGYVVVEGLCQRAV